MSPVPDISLLCQGAVEFDPLSKANRKVQCDQALFRSELSGLIGLECFF